MGTNYYLTLDPCPHCGRGSEELHIGKSSSGWCFSLATHPEKGIYDLEDWLPLFDTGIIRSEDGNAMTKTALVSVITERAGRDWAERSWDNEEEFHRRNYSERGPNGLLRHRISPYCLKQGEGTWDCLVGEFS